MAKTSSSAGSTPVFGQSGSSARLPSCPYMRRIKLNCPDPFCQIASLLCMLV